MKLIIKTFEELSTIELYEILKARAEIFVVEQNCIYQDLDDLDYHSLHVFFQGEDGKVQAYLRIFEKEEKGVVQIGRVLTVKHGMGLGGKLLHEGIEAIKKMQGIHKIFLEAQVYAIGFYQREGFEICSEEFLEDGIPHVAMELHIK